MNADRETTIHWLARLPRAANARSVGSKLVVPWMAGERPAHAASNASYGPLIGVPRPENQLRAASASQGWWHECASCRRVGHRLAETTPFPWVASRRVAVRAPGWTDRRAIERVLLNALASRMERQQNRGKGSDTSWIVGMGCDPRGIRRSWRGFQVLLVPAP
jgi:hypothetical protein